jgi:Na+/alanine symporter
LYHPIYGGALMVIKKSFDSNDSGLSTKRYSTSGFTVAHPVKKSAMLMAASTEIDILVIISLPLL